MFNLEVSQLKGLRILDCPSGTSSFVAEAFDVHNIKQVVGCDMLYDIDNLNDIEKRGREDINYMVKKLSEVSEFYDWTMYKNPKDLFNARNNSLKKFLSDYKLNQHKAKFK